MTDPPRPGTAVKLAKETIELWTRFITAHTTPLIRHMTDPRPMMVLAVSDRDTVLVLRGDGTIFTVPNFTMLDEIP